MATIVGNSDGIIVIDDKGSKAYVTEEDARVIANWYGIGKRNRDWPDLVGWLGFLAFVGFVLWLLLK